MIYLWKFTETGTSFLFLSTTLSQSPLLLFPVQKWVLMVYNLLCLILFGGDQIFKSFGQTEQNNTKSFFFFLFLNLQGARRSDTYQTPASHPTPRASLGHPVFPAMLGGKSCDSRFRGCTNWGSWRSRTSSARGGGLQCPSRPLCPDGQSGSSSVVHLMRISF